MPPKRIGGGRKTSGDVSRPTRSSTRKSYVEEEVSDEEFFLLNEKQTRYNTRRSSKSQEIPKNNNLSERDLRLLKRNNIPIEEEPEPEPLDDVKNY